MDHADKTAYYNRILLARDVGTLTALMAELTGDDPGKEDDDSNELIAEADRLRRAMQAAREGPDA